MCSIYNPRSPTDCTNFADRLHINTHKDQILCHLILDKCEKRLESSNVIRPRLKGNRQQAETHVDHDIGIVLVIWVDQ